MSKGFCEQEMGILMSRLEKLLGIVDTDYDTYLLLEECIINAKEDLELYLNLGRRQLPKMLHGKLVELAAISYQQTQQSGGVKSSSYSEGDTSQSVTYTTAQDAQAAKEALLRSVAHYRRRATW